MDDFKPPVDEFKETTVRTLTQGSPRWRATSTVSGQLALRIECLAAALGGPDETLALEVTRPPQGVPAGTCSGGFAVRGGLRGHDRSTAGDGAARCRFRFRRRGRPVARWPGVGGRGLS